MRAALQRRLWLVIFLRAGTVFAAEPEHGLPQSAVRIEHWGGFINRCSSVGLSPSL